MAISPELTAMDAETMLQIAFSIFMIILFVAVIASFIPQIGKLWFRKKSDGISLTWTVLNLVIASYHFAMAVGIVHAAGKELPVVLWPVFCIFAAHWAGQLIIFIQKLIYPPARAPEKVFAVLAYVTFLVLSVGLIVNVVYAYIRAPQGDDDWSKWVRRWADVTLFVFVMIFGGFIITIFGFIAVWPQIIELDHGDSPRALSITGCRAQAVVYSIAGFTCVAIAWFFPERIGEWRGYVVLVALNAIMFAVEQAVLPGYGNRSIERGVFPSFARGLKKNGTNAIFVAETRPLLQTQSGTQRGLDTAEE